MGQGVGAEAAVVNRKTHSKAWVAEVGVVPRQHLGTDHALVDNRSAAQGSDVQVVSTISPESSTNSGSDPTTQAQQKAFKGSIFGIAIEHPLLNDRSCFIGHGTDHRWVHRNSSPSKGAQTESPGLLITEAAVILTTIWVLRHEHHAEAFCCSRFRPDVF